MRELTKWDLRFLRLAAHIAEWSKDDSTKVGAVIASPDHRVISVGFNGFPKGIDDTILNREQKYARTVHAEANALHFANRDVTGCSGYVTHPPCCNCASHIIQRGLAEVAFVEPDDYFLERWEDSYREALRMFKEAGTTLLVAPAYLLKD